MLCAHRFERFILFALLLLLPVCCLAQASTETALSNKDIVKMMHAGIPESIILRKIQMSPNSFGTSPSALIDLKKHGASEAILGAVLDSQGGQNGYAAGSSSIPYPTGPTMAQGPHHLPSFEADLQLKSKTHNKISVGQNHIEVKQGRVPLFSLKWKETPRDNKTD